MSIYREAAQLLERDLRGLVAESDIDSARARGDQLLLVQTYLRQARDKGFPIRSDTAAALRDITPPKGNLDAAALEGLELN
ncbi:hypothetical protein GA0111570_111105 [Raineyella antarctica]|uniref:Uncharacterized protein n=1 Tax=Raineyella antarctica TaxID=1577474 RepID=A0A1G6HMV1_9ACTN|nr:hypothetical protein [Raineyella antarctica]SDB95637.1 hypothetical protein GA0111570_111105 [Raineyella antarctica]